MTLVKLAAGLLALGVAGGVTAVGVGQTGGKVGEPAKVAEAPAVPPAAVPESARDRAARRRAFVAAETEALDNCFWVAKSKTVNGKPFDLDAAPEVYRLEFTKAAFPPSMPAAPGTKDVVRVFDQAPRIGQPGVGGSDVVPFKLNPHRTPKELTLARTRTDRAPPPPITPDPHETKRGEDQFDPIYLAQYDFYQAFIYELAGDELRLARYDGADEADRPRGFTVSEQPPGAPDLIVVGFERVPLNRKK